MAKTTKAERGLTGSFRWYFSWPLILSALLLCALAKIPPLLILRSMRPLLFILLFTSVFSIFGSTGEPQNLLTPPEWKLHIYTDGLWRALFMFLRILVLISTTGVLLSYTTTPIDLTDGMENLFSPLKRIKIPVHDIAMMTSIALRFIPTLMEETEKIMNAQKARGADFQSGGLIKRAKALLPIFIPLLNSAFKRADELATAMDCRCYNGGEGRTKWKIFHFGLLDGLALATPLALGVGIFFLNRFGIGYTMV